MSKLVWVFGWVGVTLWSLFCLLAYGLIDVVGRLFMSNANMMSDNPETVEGIWKVLSWLHSASTGAVLVIWAIVSLLILAVPWVFGKLLASPNTRVTVTRFGVAPGHVAGDVVDLGPDQYSVRPTSTVPGSAGTGPGSMRIDPRR